MSCDNVNNSNPIGIGYDSRGRAKSFMELSAVVVETISATNYENIPSVGGVTELSGLSDVCDAAGSPGTNQALIYNGSEWCPSTLPDPGTGGGGGVSSFSSLSEVTELPPYNTNEIAYFSSTNEMGVEHVSTVVTVAGGFNIEPGTLYATSANVSSIETSTIDLSAYISANENSWLLQPVTYPYFSGLLDTSMTITNVEEGSIAEWNDDELRWINSTRLNDVETSTIDLSSTLGNHVSDDTIHFVSGDLNLGAMAFQANLVYPDNYTAAEGYSEGTNDGDLVSVNSDTDNLLLIPSSTFALATELGALGSKDTVESGDVAAGAIDTAAIEASAVSLDKMGGIDPSTVIGNLSSFNTTPQALNMEQLRTILRPVLRCPFHSAGDSAINLTNHPSTDQFLSNNNRNIQLVDLSNYSQVRISHRTVTNSGSANNPRLVAKYVTTYTQTVGSYLDLGTTEVSSTLASYQIQTSGWVDLASGAKVDDVYISVIQTGGDSATTPRAASIFVEFR